MGNKAGGLSASLKSRESTTTRESLGTDKKQKNTIGVSKTTTGVNGSRQGAPSSAVKAGAGQAKGAAGGAAGSLSPKGGQASQLTPPPTPSASTNNLTPPKSAAGAASVPASEVKGGDFSHYDSRLTSADFELLKVLGKGSFGKVMLVKKKDDPAGTLYALKTLRKAALVKRNQLAHTTTERKILQDIHCPFLVHLVFAFQTVDKLYMVLDYMAGGELFFWLKKDRRFSESRCRLYAAEISLALDALHSADIVYRDLKPENILLDAAGHIRLTDFGLAKDGVTTYNEEGGTKTFCGTPEYLAPEILENKGHGKAVDWWALGTLLFEIMTGLPPFYDSNIHKMYQKILHDPIKFPKGENRAISAASRAILSRLLERKIALRLGSSGLAEVEDQDFFSPLDFRLVYQHSYTPEFRPPEARSETDVRNFDREFTSEAAMDSLVVSNMTGTMLEKTQFDGFTYAPTTNVA